MTDFNKESKFLFKGNPYTWQSFVDEFCPGSAEETVKAVLETLERKGSIVAVKDSMSAGLKAIEAAAKEESITNLAQAIEEEEENRKDYQKELKDGQKLRHEYVEINYPSYSDAVQAMNKFESELRLHNIDLIQRQGTVVLGFHSITESDLAYITRCYNLDKASAFVTGTIGKGVGAATGAVDYTAQKIVVPTLQIGAKAGASLLKSVIHAATRTGATLVTSTSQGMKETARDVRNDPDIIKAAAELIDAKDGIKRGIAGRTTGNTSGINIIR